MFGVCEFHHFLEGKKDVELVLGLSTTIDDQNK
jgi:hypothetical protein